MRMQTSHFWIAILFLTANNAFFNLAEAATAQLTKQCFRSGEEISVRFNDVDGEGVFVGLYPSADIPQGILPEIFSPSLKKWILTCGRRDNCDEWPVRGLVNMPTDGLPNGEYIIAVSGNRNGRVPQALTQTFQVGGTCQVTTTSLTTGTSVGSSPGTPAPVPALTRAPVPAPTRAPIVAPTPAPIPQASPSFVVGGDIQFAMDEARFQIENLIRNDGDLTGKFLRLMFHDCIGGCDGCVDMANPDNAGLDKPINVLQNIANNFESRGLTRTDIWILAALTATETALPTSERDLLFDMQWVGRKTCEQKVDCGLDFNGNPSTCTAMRGPHVPQAHATMGTRSIQSFFETEFNFSPQQVTALMGAHSVGQMSRQNSGFTGRWDLSSAELDGGYWIELIGNPPNFFLEDVINNDLPGMPNRRQWAGIVSADSRVTMLHTDIALVRFVDDMQNGNSNCNFNGFNSCTQDTPFMPHARRYLASNREWLLDFRSVMNVLSEHGHEKSISCPFNRICSFGFQQPGSLTNGPLSSSNGGQQFTIPATVSTHRSCYNPGEIMVVEYRDIVGTDVWVGIFRSSDAPDLQNLPAGPFSQSDLLKDWTFACGHRTGCHTWTPVGGFQFTTNNLEPGSYTVVVSGNGGSLQGQAATSVSIGGC